MAVTRIYYFEIIGTPSGAATYGKRFEEAVGPGDYADKIAEAARTGSLPGEIHADSADRPMHEKDVHDGNLEIFGSTHETCAYAFRLNGVDGSGRQRLEFVADPFIMLPLNSSGGEDFLTDFRTYEGEPRRWASFVCDHRAVRTSALAERVRSLMADHGAHPIRLKLPFLFNVVDPVELNASPWVVPDEAHEHRRGLGIVIHGGVHPKSMASLLVEI